MIIDRHPLASSAWQVAIEQVAIEQVAIEQVAIEQVAIDTPLACCSSEACREFIRRSKQYWPSGPAFWSSLDLANIGE